MPTTPTNVQNRVRRWREQRWIVDQVIQANGIEWDQDRVGYLLAPAGVNAFADFEEIRSQCKKYDDIARAYAAGARRREEAAKRLDTEGDRVGAREGWFIASLLYGGAMWPIMDRTAALAKLNARKVECYRRYAALVEHPVRRVEIPFEDGVLPGWLHLPRGADTAGDRFPCVLSTDGLDGFKEMLAFLYGDALLERGMAVLILDGPGQGECTVDGPVLTPTNFVGAGKAAIDWLQEQPEIDGERIAVRGVSLGSLWGLQLAAADPRVKAVAAAYAGHERGIFTGMEKGSPATKLRMMFVTGQEDEAALDALLQEFDGMPAAANVRCPVFMAAGEDDDFSAIERTYALMNKLRGPKTLVLYQGERHSLHTGPSSFRGPSEVNWIGRWLEQRFAGEPARSEHILVSQDGQVHPEPWGDDERQYEFVALQE